MSTILTQSQIPDKAILDFYNKQAYLGNAYLVNTNVQSTVAASGEQNLLLLTNPASNATYQISTGSPVQSLSLFQGVRKLIVVGNGATSVTFRFYFNPTGVTGGTPITPVNLKTGSSNTSKMTAKLAPTTATKGTFVAAFSVNYQEIDSTVMFVLDPASSLLVTAQPAADTQVVTELSWYEL